MSEQTECHKHKWSMETTVACDCCGVIVEDYIYQPAVKALEVIATGELDAIKCKDIAGAAFELMKARKAETKNL
jgi:hypothetical protein